MTHLYLIYAGDEINNMDLVVRADGHVDAVALWREHYETTDKPTKVFVIEDQGTRGVLRWGHDVMRSYLLSEWHHDDEPWSLPRDPDREDFHSDG